MTTHGRDRQFDWLGTDIYSRPPEPAYLPINEDTLAGRIPVASAPPEPAVEPEEIPVTAIRNPSPDRPRCAAGCNRPLRADSKGDTCSYCRKQAERATVAPTAPVVAAVPPPAPPEPVLPVTPPPQPWSPQLLTTEQLQLCQPEMVRRLAEDRAREILRDLAARIGGAT